MALRATEMYENGRDGNMMAPGEWRPEVVPALEKLRPLTESDPDCAFEPIVGTRLSARTGESP